MNNNHNISEIKAELLLNYLHPELIDKFFAYNKGTFYRNYNPDILSLDVDRLTVKLSRNGFLGLLPQGFITKDNDLRGGDFKEKYRRLKDKQILLQESFIPIDSYFLRKNLRIESNVSDLLQSSIDHTLKQYIGYDSRGQTNEYIQTVAPLLLAASRLRADYGFIRVLLAQLIGGKVEMTISRYTQSDRVTCSLPYVRYVIIVKDLTNQQFKEMNDKLTPFYDFLKEWFIPFDVKCSFELKHPHQKFALGTRPLTLNYNTELTVL